MTQSKRPPGKSQKLFQSLMVKQDQYMPFNAEIGSVCDKFVRLGQENVT
ncbi:hypothetical protein CLOSCI_00793 [[Clostridium] scindens ATCC 35704]|nr:hypothetical protein CLOSCI_00793 [[Clostridium] scindens ATCC 35704]